MKKVILLILSFVFVLGGCSEEIKESEIQILVDKSVKINKNQYYTTSFKTNYDAKLKVEIKIIDGGPNEGYFMTENDYRNFDKAMQTHFGLPIKYIGSLSYQNTNNNFSSEWTFLPKGSYVFAVENTDFGVIKSSEYSHVRIIIKGVKE